MNLFLIPTTTFHWVPLECHQAQHRAQSDAQFLRDLREVFVFCGAQAYANHFRSFGVDPIGNLRHICSVAHLVNTRLTVVVLHILLRDDWTSLAKHQTKDYSQKRSSRAAF